MTTALPPPTSPSARFQPSAPHPYGLAPPLHHAPTAPTAAPPPPTQPGSPPRPQPQPQPGLEPDLLLCLGPHCSARFRTEAALNAHYQAEHSFTCNWVSCKAASFTSNNALVWHVKAEHLLVCPVPGCCEMAYPAKKVLDAHLKEVSHNNGNGDVDGGGDGGDGGDGGGQHVPFYHPFRAVVRRGGGDDPGIAGAAAARSGEQSRLSIFSVS